MKHERFRQIFFSFFQVQEDITVTEEGSKEEDRQLNIILFYISSFLSVFFFLFVRLLLCFLFLLLVSISSCT